MPMSHYRPKIEICVEGPDEALAAARAGADRIELCAALSEGGITPSRGVVRETRRRFEDEGLACLIFPIVRPRGGDFLYSEAEFSGMLDDVTMMREENMPGVVSGCLLPDGRMDAERMIALVDASGSMSFTCHRAFDMTSDALDALETLVSCGVSRVLTSGQTSNSRDGLPLLRQLIEVANGRITILVCGAFGRQDIDPDRRGLTGYEFHFGAAKTGESLMEFRNPKASMSDARADIEYKLRIPDTERMEKMISTSLS